MLAEGRHPASAAPLGLCHIALMSLFIVTGNWPTLSQAPVSYVEMYSKGRGWRPPSGDANAGIGGKNMSNKLELHLWRPAAGPDHTALTGATVKCVCLVRPCQKFCFKKI